jgi:CheY-like chemotaxis protein
MSTILVVDDLLSNRELLHLRIEKLGHEVLEAEDGESALAIVQEKRPDLILLDILMPKVDGWQVCRMLKANPKTKSIPVVMLSALSADEIHLSDSAADAYMPKPWDSEQLARLLKKWLPPTEKRVA